MRKLVLAAGIALVAALAVRGASLHASSADAVTIHVSTMDASPAEFSVRYFGGPDSVGAGRDRLTTPMDVVIPGTEAYALFRQTGGKGEMRVDVRNGIGSGSTHGAIAMIIVTKEKLGVTSFAR